jgi:putative acetyltransferase
MNSNSLLRLSLRAIIRAHGFLNDKCQFSNLPHSHIHALIELEEKPLLSKELARILQLDKSSISRLVKNLKTKKYIKDCLNKEDKRQKLITLTESGRKLLSATHVKADNFIARGLNFIDFNKRELIINSIAEYSRAITKAVLLSKIKIRVANSNDDPILAKIIIEELKNNNALKPGTIGFDPEVNYLSKALNGINSVYYVAEYEGEVLGGGGIGPTSGLPSDTLELKRMFITKKAQGMGIGKLIMSKCFDFAKSKGFKKCYLETLDELIIARKFYAQEGFKPLRKPLGNSGHNACSYWMIKQI